jgi:hypothetical protein
MRAAQSVSAFLGGCRNPGIAGHHVHGRGDYPLEDFHKALEETWVDADRELEVEYMLGKMSVPEHFADGFEKLSRARMI